MRKYIFLAIILFPLVTFGQTPGPDKSILFNDVGVVSGDPNLIWDKFKTQIKVTNEGFFPAFLAETTGTGFQFEGTQTLGGAVNIFGITDPANISTQGIHISPAFAPTNPGKIYYGILNTPQLAGSKNIDSVIGTFSAPFTRFNAPYSGTAKELVGYDFVAAWNSSGSVDNFYGYRVSSPEIVNGKISNIFGLFISDIYGASNNFAIKTGKGTVSFGDKVGIGVDNPTADLQVSAKSPDAITKIQFGKPGQNKGTCIVLYDTEGKPVHMYFEAGKNEPTFSRRVPSVCNN